MKFAVNIHGTPNNEPIDISSRVMKVSSVYRTNTNEMDRLLWIISLVRLGNIDVSQQINPDGFSNLYDALHRMNFGLSGQTLNLSITFLQNRPLTPAVICVQCLLANVSMLNTSIMSISPCRH